MSKYDFSNLNPYQFEDLVILICKELFGKGVQPFAPGKDGGRDGRFEGIADDFPSRRSPWQGITIIQAKHASYPNASFSDSDFFRNNALSKATLNEEIKKICKLKKEGELDNYALFSNRSLTAGKNEEILRFISKTCDIPRQQIRLFGKEELTRFMNEYGHIYAIFKKDLDVLDFYPDMDFSDLHEIIENLHEVIQATNDNVGSPIGEDLELKRIEFQEKNKKNKLGKEYSDYIIQKFLIYSTTIHKFLELPENGTIRQLYEDTAVEINAKILAYQKDHNIEEAMESLIMGRCFKQNAFLNKHKKETRSVIYHMYWACDIGSNV